MINLIQVGKKIVVVEHITNILIQNHTYDNHLQVFVGMTGEDRVDFVDGDEGQRFLNALEAFTNKHIEA